MVDTGSELSVDLHATFSTIVEHDEEVDERARVHRMFHKVGLSSLSKVKSSNS